MIHPPASDSPSLPDPRSSGVALRPPTAHTHTHTHTRAAPPRSRSPSSPRSARPVLGRGPIRSHRARAQPDGDHLSRGPKRLAGRRARQDHRRERRLPLAMRSTRTRPRRGGGTYYEEVFAAAPDLRIDVTDVAADGEVVLAAWELTATFTGAPFHGLRPNASRVRLEGASYACRARGSGGSEVTCGVDGSVRSGRGRDGQPRPGAGMEGEEGRAARAWSVAVTGVAEHPRVKPRGGSRAPPLGGCVSSRGRPPVGRPPGRCIGRFGRHRCRRWSAAAGSPQRPTRSCQAGQPWTARWPSFCGAGSYLPP